MKIIIKSLVLISLFLATQMVIAGSYTDYATVTSIEKVYKQYMTEEPYQECYIKETLQNQGAVVWRKIPLYRQDMLSVLVHRMSKNHN